MKTTKLLGGLIVNTTEEIPQKDEVVVIIDQFQFTILEVSSTKIDVVKLKLARFSIRNSGNCTFSIYNGF